jgi:hypothetical protein
VIELHELRPVGLDFLESAPVRFDYAAELPAPGPTVFAAIAADPSTWTWFPGLTDAGYTSAPPHGAGSTRAVVMGGVSYRETMLAWEAPTRWAYRVDESGEDTFRALAEDWTVDDLGDRAVLRWAFCVDPAPEVAPLIAGAKDVIGGVWLDAMDGLAAYLTDRDHAG